MDFEFRDRSPIRELELPHRYSPDLGLAPFGAGISLQNLDGSLEGRSGKILYDFADLENYCRNEKEYSGQDYSFLPDLVLAQSDYTSDDADDELDDSGVQPKNLQYLESLGVNKNLQYLEDSGASKNLQYLEDSGVNKNLKYREDSGVNKNLQYIEDSVVDKNLQYLEDSGVDKNLQYLEESNSQNGRDGSKGSGDKNVSGHSSEKNKSLQWREVKINGESAEDTDDVPGNLK